MYNNEFIYNSIGHILCPLHKIYNIKKNIKFSSEQILKNPQQWILYN